MVILITNLLNLKIKLKNFNFNQIINSSIVFLKKEKMLL